jgi:hypothetical protein
MFYHAFAAVPDWAPPHENHILYSEGIIRDVVYDRNQVAYTATADNGTEYLRLAFKPQSITVNGELISPGKALDPDTYMLRSLGKGDFALTIRHKNAGKVSISN